MSFFFQRKRQLKSFNIFLVLLGIFLVTSYIIVQYFFYPSLYKDLWYIYPSSINLLKTDTENKFLSIESKKNQEWKIKKYALMSSGDLDISFRYLMTTSNETNWFFMKKNIKLRQIEKDQIFSFIDGGNIHRMYKIPENVKKFYIFTNMKLKGESKDCNGVFILNASKSSCLPIFNLKNSQKTTSTFEIQSDHDITLGFTGFVNSTISISEISIFYFDPISKGKHILPIMRPEKVSLSLNFPNSVVPQIFYLPMSAKLTNFKTSLKTVGRKIIDATFTVAPNTKILVEDFSIFQNRRQIKPILFSSIFELPIFIFFNKNIAGHSLVAIGLLCLLLSKRVNLFLLSFVVIGLAIYLSGSRTALIAFIIGTTLKLLSIKLNRKVFIVSFFILISFFSLTALLYPEYFSRLNGFEQNNISRQSIWRVALHQILAYPLGGNTEEFTNVYQRLYPQNKSDQVNHAHNFWLQMGVRFGIFGILGAFVLTFGIIWTAWNFGSWRGISFVTPFFIMNMLDYSLDYPGVWIPLVIGLWSLFTLKSKKG